MSTYVGRAAATPTMSTNGFEHYYCLTNDLWFLSLNVTPPGKKRWLLSVAGCNDCEEVGWIY